MRTTYEIAEDLTEQSEGHQIAAMRAADELELLFDEIVEAKRDLGLGETGEHWYGELVRTLREAWLTKSVADAARSALFQDYELRRSYWAELDERERKTS